MGKTRPAAAGGTPVSAAEQLAALEAELAAAGPLDHTDEAAVLARLNADEQLDDLRNAARQEHTDAASAALGAAEADNYLLASHDFEADPQTGPVATQPEPSTVTSGEEGDRG